MRGTSVGAAVDAPNLFVEADGRRLVSRDIGAGRPIVLCPRFRGILDAWDPAFLVGTLHLFTFPQAGHGPQHQHPQISADLIASFVRNTPA